jgi:hypothetical protein
MTKKGKRKADTPFCAKTKEVKTRNKVNLTSDYYGGQCAMKTHGLGMLIAAIK